MNIKVDKVLGKARESDEFDSSGLPSVYMLRANNLSDVASVLSARSNLGLVIGTNVQAYSANLDEYAAVNPTAAGLALLDDADAAAQRTTLGIIAGGAGDIWVEKAGDTMTGNLLQQQNFVIGSGAVSGSYKLGFVDLVGSDYLQFNYGGNFKLSSGANIEFLSNIVSNEKLYMHDEIVIDNDIAVSFLYGAGQPNSFKAGSDGTFLFDIGAGNSVKIKGGDSIGGESLGYTDTSFNNEWQVNTFGRSTQNGGMIVNEEGQDSDTRLEGDTDANLFFLDASTDMIGIGHSAPTAKLHLTASSAVTSSSTYASLFVGTNTAASGTASVIALQAKTLYSGSYNQALDTDNTNTQAFYALSQNTTAFIANALKGGVAQVESTSSGGVRRAIGYQSYVHTGGSGVITLGYGFYATAWADAGNITTYHAIHIDNGVSFGATITDQVGLYIDSLTGGGTSNSAITTNNGNIIFNESGDANTDFRVEGDTNTNLLFVDASTDRVGFGNNTPGTAVNIGTAFGDAGANTSGLSIQYSNGASPIGMYIQNTGASGAASGAGFVMSSNDAAAMGSGDRLGFMLWAGGTGSTIANVAGFTVFTTEAWGAGRGTEVRVETVRAGQTSRAIACVFRDGGGLIVNEQGADSDTRMEGDTNANLFYLDASVDRVGIRTDTPFAVLDMVSGADANGAADPVALAIQHRNGGYRNFIRSRHDGVGNAVGNAFDFYVNTGTTAGASTAPGTNNLLVLSLQGVESVFNEGGADQDLRVEGDTDTNLLFLNAGTDRIGIGTSGPLTKLEINGFNTGNSQMKIGSLELQPYSLGNGFITENCFFNGSSFQYRATGSAGLFYFFGTEGQFRFVTSGSAGANATNLGTYAQLKTNVDGSFAVGALMSSAVGNYSAATFKVDSNGIGYIQEGTSTAYAKIGGFIFDHYTDTTVGGAEADIYTATTVANALGRNGDKIIAEYGGNFVTVGTELTQLKVYFAGTAIWDSTGVAPTTGTTSWRVWVEIIRVSSTVVRYTVSLNTTGASGFVYCTVGELTGLTLSGTNILKITGTSSGVGSGSGDIIGKMGYVRWAPAA